LIHSDSQSLPFAQVLRREELENDRNILGVQPEDVEDQLEMFRRYGGHDAVQKVENAFRALLRLRLSQDPRGIVDVQQASGIQEALRGIKIG